MQKEAISAILEHKDLLMILPTGGGKSLCYQLPSLLMDGVSVVISPLLALMYDQVLALEANGINAKMISSMQTNEQIQQIKTQLRHGEIKLLYIAPERFASLEFVSFLKTIQINFFVIDEAHCVSEWGHEFRADYRKLNLLRENFPTTSIAAFTATATPRVATDIQHALLLDNPLVLRGKVFRDNLFISVEQRIKDGKKQLLSFLKNFPKQSGIIYTLSRKQTESLALFLNKNGIKAKAFHAGLPLHVKEQTFKEFVRDELEVVVATIAFGMGIDKSNIRFVVHMSLPKTIENYYQEIGRAGRDGLKSDVLLLYSAADAVMQREFIQQLEPSVYKQHAFNKIEQMSRYATMQECRHRFIAEYFEDEIDGCKDSCDNCTAPPSQDTDISIYAQKFLSAIFKTGQSFGQAYVIDVLRGSKIQKILNNSHDSLSVYGIGADMPKEYWSRICERLMEVGALKRDEFRALVIDKYGIDILKGKKNLFIAQNRLLLKVKKEAAVFEETGDERFQRLREFRAKIAQEQNKPAYVIFNDKTLKEIAVSLPVTKEQMLDINGVAEVKFQRYGEQFMQFCLQLKKEIS